MKTNFLISLVLILAVAGLALWLMFRKPAVPSANIGTNENFAPTARNPKNWQLGFLSGSAQRGTDWGQVASAGAGVIGSIAGLFGKKKSSTASYDTITTAQTSNTATWVDTPTNSGNVLDDLGGAMQV